MTLPDPASSGGGSGAPSAHAVRWRFVRRWLWRGASVLVLVVVVDYLVLPQLAGAERSVHLLRNASPWVVGLAVVLEASSLAAYSLPTATLLTGNRTPSFGRVLGADVTGLGVSHALPGGAATGNAIRFRLLRQDAARGEVAVGLTLEGVLSVTAIVSLLWVALVASIPFSGVSPSYLRGAVIGALVLAVIGLGLVGHGRQEALAPRVVRRAVHALPHRTRPRLERAIEAGANRLQSLLRAVARCGPRGCTPP